MDLELKALCWPRTVRTLSTFSKASKKGSKSNNSVSLGSSNHEVTGTYRGREKHRGSEDKKKVERESKRKFISLMTIFQEVL